MLKVGKSMASYTAGFDSGTILAVGGHNIDLLYSGLDLSLYYFYGSPSWSDEVSKQLLTITDLATDRYNDKSGDAIGANEANLDPDGTLNVGPAAYEQLILKSEDMTDGVWVKDTGVIVTAITFLGNAQFDFVGQVITTLDGDVATNVYNLSFVAHVASGGQTGTYRFRHQSSATGNSSSLTLSEEPTKYSITVLGRSGGGDVNFGLADNNSSDWAEVTITDFQVTASTYRLPYAPNPSDSATLLVPSNETDATHGYSYPIGDGSTCGDNLLDAFDGVADGVIENSGNLVAANRYEIVTTEADHFGAGKVIDDRITGLTTALDANNTVKQISAAKAEMVIPEFTPTFAYDISGIAAGNIINVGNGTAIDPLRFDATGGIALDDGATVATAAAVNWTASTPYQITAQWGPSSELSSELMPNQVDRDFSGASAWANVDVNAYDETGDLTITATSAGQYCTCPVLSAPTTIGKGYQLTYDIANIVSTWIVQSFDGTQVIGTISANATQGILTWTAETTGGYRIVSGETDSSCDFDNFTLKATNQPKMQLSVTDGTTTWNSALTDFVGTFSPGDYMKLGYDNNEWFKLGTKPYILKIADSTIDCYAESGTTVNSNLVLGSDNLVLGADNLKLEV